MDVIPITFLAGAELEPESGNYRPIVYMLGADGVERLVWEGRAVTWDESRAVANAVDDFATALLALTRSLTS